MYPELNTYDTVDWGQPINWSHPLNRGLQAMWLAVPNRAGWRSRVWRDLLGRNHGTLTNMDYATDWVGSSARRGGRGYVDFDGSNDYVSIPGPHLTTPMTVSMWLRLPTSYVEQGHLIGAYGTSSPFTGWGLRVGLSSSIYEFWDGTSWRSSSSGVTTLLWHHLAVSADGSSARFYVNGVAFGAPAMASVSSFTGTKAIGARRDGVAPQSFFADVIRFHNRALSASEIAAEYIETARGGFNLLNRIRLPRCAEQAAAATTRAYLIGGGISGILGA